MKLILFKSYYYNTVRTQAICIIFTAGLALLKPFPLWTKVGENFINF